MDYITIAWAVGGIVAFFLGFKFFTGLVIIPEDGIGIVVRKFGKALPPGRIIAVNGEAGYQAQTLGPGYHFGFFPWQYSVEHEDLTHIPSGEIGIVVSADGAQIPNSRVLGLSVNCDNFQDAAAFIQNGGEKGRQLGILTGGTYRINTQMFTIITPENAKDYQIDPRLLKVLSINANEVGVVTTSDGAAIASGEIAATPLEGHDNYQNGTSFVQKGGQRGLQEQVLMSGTWNINPWFATVERMDMTEVEIGHVGVVISYVGKATEDISGDEFKHGTLVARGHKGVWAEPLNPGRHPLNPKTTKVEQVPTTNIALNWATNRSESHKLDENLSSITVRSKDGFSFVLDVTQVIHVSAKDASRVICRFGTMMNLVSQVLEPAIGNYFRNSAQEFTVLDFLSNRKERQESALAYIRAAIGQYNIETVDTYIGDIVPPQALMDTQTSRKIAEEQKKTYEVQEAAQKQRQSFEKESSLANIQGQLVANEQAVAMSEFQAQATIKKAEGDAKAVEVKAKADSEATRLKGVGDASAVEAVGIAKAKGYEAQVKAMGKETFGSVQVIKEIAENKLKVTPDFLVTSGNGGSGDSSGLMLTAFLAETLRTSRAIPVLPLESK